jgi:hypothetical protein
LFLFVSPFVFPFRSRFRPGFRFALEAIDFACSLPLLAISFAIAGLGTAAAAVAALFRRQRPAAGMSTPAAWSSDQFAFGRAVDAYEDLIDAHSRSQP